MTDYEPVLNYKMSFDPMKGDKKKMDVHYRATFNDDGETPRTMKRYAEVRICVRTTTEETLYTYEKFLCERKRIKMPWKEIHELFRWDASASFRNKHKVDNNSEDYDADEDGFKEIIED